MGPEDPDARDQPGSNLSTMIMLGGGGRSQWAWVELNSQPYAYKAF